ncbi:MAG: hypothetical protein PHF86_00030 [Candidatus Nanoarchaeia archaeon]|nr:hypothetical protein [Candidatus Nanoarchaeia archaeon]
MEIINIYILPAKFVKQLDDGKYCIKVLNDNIIEERIFDEYSLKGIKNPKYLLIGILTGKGFMQINFCDANEFKKLFIKKYGLLLKE